jgi:hypothetical protein
LKPASSHIGVLQTSRASNDRRRQGALAFLAACAIVMFGAGAMADESDEAERKVLKVCADPNNLPFSNQQGEGYENKLAELFGHEMGLPVETYFQAQRLNFVRNTLRFKLPGEDYRCDIMMGVPGPITARPTRWYTSMAADWRRSRALPSFWRCRRSSYGVSRLACSTVRLRPSG